MSKRNATTPVRKRVRAWLRRRRGLRNLFDARDCMASLNLVTTDYGVVREEIGSAIDRGEFKATGFGYISTET